TAPDLTHGDALFPRKTARPGALLHATRLKFCSLQTAPDLTHGDALFPRKTARPGALLHATRLKFCSL
ncbi:hypothetical protein QWT36_23945, partial [Salmonella enterica subsp. enterica serovar Typhi]|nr:hypothetical protein [Salmonella enterica subsp. enterica serovar Typhi]